MFFFLAFNAKSIDICPCEVHSGLNYGCCCAGLTDRSQYPPGCYPDFPSSIIPTCPSKHWRQRIGLTSFLSEELFCISTDNRDVATGRSTDSFNSTNITTYVPTYSSEVDQDAINGRYSPDSIIRLSTGKYFTLPNSGASTNCMDSLSIYFFSNVDEQKCVTTTGISTATYKSLQIPSIPGTQNYVPFTFSDGTNTYTSANVPTENMKSLDLVIYYANDTTLAITSMVFNYVKDDTNFQNSASSEFSLSVRFQINGTGEAFNSGLQGYNDGAPVIAAHYENNQITIFNNYATNILPIAFGNDCNTATYSALKYGVDTLGMCGTSTTGKYNTGTNPLLYPRKLNAFARHGNPDPANLHDWYVLNDLDFDGCTDNSMYQYVFYTVKNGTSKIPINMIHKVQLTCLPDSGDVFGITAAFVEMPQKVERDIGEFPIWLATLPNDTWSPFA